MSNVKIQGNPSGSGTVTIAAPNTNADRTLTLPDGSGALYNQSNIVGTVSQSGGVPTGAIIERGSNANGEYVRYADGTQICWLRDTSFSVTNTATYAIQGITFYRNLHAWTFPVAFSTATGLSVTNNVTQNDLNMFVSAYPELVTTTGVNLQNLTVFPWNAFARIQVTATAIGRWY